MHTTSIERYHYLQAHIGRLATDLPGPMSGFARLHKKAMEGGDLSAQTKEMMALAISIVVGCDDCITYHTHDAIAAGATRAELLETIGVALLMGGGPASMHATHAMDTIEQLLPAAAEAAG